MRLCDHSGSSIQCNTHIPIDIWGDGGSQGGKKKNTLKNVCKPKLALWYPDAPKENEKQNTTQGGSKQNIKHCCEWHKRQRSFSKTSITKNTTLGLIRLSMLKFRKAWTRLKSRNTNVVKSQLSRLCVRASISCHGCHVTQLLALPFAAFHPTALFVFLSSCTFLVCSPSLHQY